MSPYRLRPWLQRVPPSAARLELRYEAIGGEQVLAGYARKECDAVSDLADALVDVAQDHCDTLQQGRITVRAVWLDERGAVLGTKPMRVELSAEAAAEADDEDEVAVEFSGKRPREDATIGGLTAQLMRHVENRERMLNMALSTNLRLMHDQLREARSEADELRRELRRERQRAKDVALAADAGSDIEAEARAEALHKVAEAVVTHIVPLAAARLREGMQ